MLPAGRQLRSQNKPNETRRPSSEVLVLYGRIHHSSSGGAEFGSDLTTSRTAPGEEEREPGGESRQLRLNLRLNLADVQPPVKKKQDSNRPNNENKDAVIFLIHDPFGPCLVLLHKTIHFSISHHPQDVITTETVSHPPQHNSPLKPRVMKRFGAGDSSHRRWGRFHHRLYTATPLQRRNRLLPQQSHFSGMRNEKIWVL